MVRSVSTDSGHPSNHSGQAAAVEDSKAERIPLLNNSDKTHTTSTFPSFARWPTRSPVLSSAASSIADSTSVVFRNPFVSETSAKGVSAEATSLSNSCERGRTRKDESPLHFGLDGTNGLYASSSSPPLISLSHYASSTNRPLMLSGHTAAKRCPLVAVSPFPRSQSFSPVLVSSNCASPMIVGDGAIADNKPNSYSPSFRSPSLASTVESGEAADDTVVVTLREPFSPAKAPLMQPGHSATQSIIVRIDRTMSIMTTSSCALLEGDGLVDRLELAHLEHAHDEQEDLEHFMNSTLDQLLLA